MEKLMIVRDMYVVLKITFTEWYREKFKESETNSKYLNQVLTVIIGGLVVWGAFKGYGYLVYRKESAAQKVLTECIAELNKAKGGIGSWYDVEVAFDMGYKQNSGSQLAPSFLVFKAEAMYQQGKVKEAIETLSKSLEAMGPKSDLFGVYSVKRALMKLDAQDEALSKEGLTELQAACQEDSSGQGVALYYTGLYYWDNNEFAKAKDAWEKLVALRDIEDVKVSQYVEQAKERLEQID